MAALAFIGGPAASATAQDESVDVTVVADQVRSQGFECDNPRFAERIAAESAPEEPVYLLTCENATYRVQLVPDQAARVIDVK
jgi:hypothetical protein